MSDSERTGMHRIISVVRERWIAVLLVPLVASVGAYAISHSVTKKYEATAILIAGQAGGSANIDLVSATNEAAVSLSSMAQDRVVIEQALLLIESGDVLPVTDPAAKNGSGTAVSARNEALAKLSRTERLKLSREADDVSHRVSVAVPAGSQKIEITVEDSSPEHARDIANAMAETFAALVTQDQVSKLNLSASIWQRAIAPAKASYPRTNLNVAAALIFGALLGVALAFLLDSLDARWNSEYEVEQVLDVVVLGTIPEINRRSARKRSYG